MEQFKTVEQLEEGTAFINQCNEMMLFKRLSAPVKPFSIVGIVETHVSIISTVEYVRAELWQEVGKG